MSPQTHPSLDGCNLGSLARLFSIDIVFPLTHIIFELHTCELECLALGSEPQSEILSYQWQIFIYLIVTSRWINHRLPANHIGTTQFSWYSPAAARGAHQWHFSSVIQQTKITTDLSTAKLLLDDAIRSPNTMGTITLDNRIICVSSHDQSQLSNHLGSVVSTYQSKILVLIIEQTLYSLRLQVLTDVPIHHGTLLCNLTVTWYSLWN